MDRFWLFTWRTYGTWLPGSTGFVGNYVTTKGERRTDNLPGVPTAEPMPALVRFARDSLREPPVYLGDAHANTILNQLHETARYRGRQLDAVSILKDHIHLIFGTPGDPDPSQMLEDWKSYASRALNRLIGWKPPATRPKWWVIGGSKRILRSESRRASAIRYVRNQDVPLVVWLSDLATELLDQYLDGPEWEDDRGEPRP
jgi:REP element-mobilizing transposase RayT